jgi:hypothetical protein
LVKLQTLLYLRTETGTPQEENSASNHERVSQANVLNE